MTAEDRQQNVILSSSHWHSSPQGCYFAYVGWVNVTCTEKHICRGYMFTGWGESQRRFAGHVTFIF